MQTTRPPKNGAVVAVVCVIEIVMKRVRLGVGRGPSLRAAVGLRAMQDNELQAAVAA